VRKLLGTSSAPPPTKQAAPTRVVPSEKPAQPYTVSVFHGNQLTQHDFVQAGESGWVERRRAKTP